MPKKSHQTEHSIKRKKKFQRIYNSSQERVIITNKYMKMNLKISFQVYLLEEIKLSQTKAKILVDD